MKIPITFLGTASTVPTETRNHMAILLSYKEEHILVDCGEGTQRQFRKAKINMNQITRILLTHLHGDHTFGLPGLFHTLALNNYSKTLYIYGPKGTKVFIDKMVNLFAKNKNITYEVKEVNGKFLETKDFTLTAVPLDHETPCNGYLFEEKDKLRINKEKLKKLRIPEKTPELVKLTQGKNIKLNNKTLNYKTITYKQKGKKISFVFDTRLCPNVKKLGKVDLAIIESTFLEDSPNGKNLAKEYYHLTAKQAAQIAKQGKAKRLALTHLSQRYEKAEDLILSEAKKVFKETVLAKDLMTLEV